MGGGKLRRQQFHKDAPPSGKRRGQLPREQGACHAWSGARQRKMDTVTDEDTDALVLLLHKEGWGEESRDHPLHPLPSGGCGRKASVLLTLISNWPPVLGLGGRGTGFPAVIWPGLGAALPISTGCSRPVLPTSEFRPSGLARWGAKGQPQESGSQFYFKGFLPVTRKRVGSSRGSLGL